MWGPQRRKFGILAEDFGCGILGILDFGSWGFRILDFGDFGFWILGILDFGSWGFWILDFGALGILDFGFWGRNPKSKIQNPKSPKSAKKVWILDRYVANLYVAPNFGDFGFWILDFGGFGDFGFWILGILDFGFWGWGDEKVWVQNYKQILDST